MKTTIKNLKEEFNNITLLRMFEIEVIDKRTNEIDYIIFDIEIYKNSLLTQFVPLTKKQEKSKKIASIKIALDPFFSLDENLNNLFEECQNAILESDFYTLN